ncbi:dATP/dGTP diphosphohydrolase domain-containing protein [Sphingopyxis flava]|uniref:dATP/dGTP diphosphohydrolase domain-containing protein n=1 Tax=Sphingopyxis flava TaxID=1507287 RepID=UPI0011160253|nr:dATP/dGTP diphosphohydrolase domain-containing protein [Sphingopyxis flava]
MDALREQIDPSITDWGEPLPASPKGTVGLDGSISGRRASVVIMDDIEADNRSSLPEDDGDRLAYPMFDGLLAYFPNALAEVAMVSMIGNQQHNPGQPMHWARGKSTDHANKAVRHLVDHGKRDARGVRHTARAAWRILALLQEEIERDEGRPLSRASRAPEPDEA